MFLTSPPSAPKRGARLFAWLIGLTLPGDFRAHYWGSIHSSYTAAELRPILERSRLQGWQIEEDVLDLAIVKGRDEAAVGDPPSVV